MIQLRAVWSGGQTGVDQAALVAATMAGFRTGGWAPAGFETLDGPNLALRDLYGLKELPSASYANRTRKNVMDTSGTIIYAANQQSPGTQLTRRAARDFSKPLLQIEMMCPHGLDEVALWLEERRIVTLNVAGNSEKTCPGIGIVAQEYFAKVFCLCKELQQCKA